MCIGIPKRIVALEGAENEWAWVENRLGGERERVNLMLVGDQPVGGWVLCALGFAREELSEEEAATIEDALSALQDALEGRYDPDNHFEDLGVSESSAPRVLH